MSKQTDKKSNDLAELTEVCRVVIPEALAELIMSEAPDLIPGVYRLASVSASDRGQVAASRMLLGRGAEISGRTARGLGAYDDVPADEAADIAAVRAMRRTSKSRFQPMTKDTAGRHTIPLRKPADVRAHAAAMKGGR